MWWKSKNQYWGRQFNRFSFPCNYFSRCSQDEVFEVLTLFSSHGLYAAAHCDILEGAQSSSATETYIYFTRSEWDLWFRGTSTLNLVDVPRSISSASRAEQPCSFMTVDWRKVCKYFLDLLRLVVDLYSLFQNTRYWNCLAKCMHKNALKSFCTLMKLIVQVHESSLRCWIWIFTCIHKVWCELTDMLSTFSPHYFFSFKPTWNGSA